MCQTTPAAKPANYATANANRGQGMNWLPQSRRLAIYLRDGFCCAYCGKGIERGIKLTLDHLVPRSAPDQVADHSPANLVSACVSCNSARQKRSVAEFAVIAAAFHNRDVSQILAFIGETTRRPLDTAAARRIMAQRGGSCKRVVDSVLAGQALA